VSLIEARPHVLLKSLGPSQRLIFDTMPLHAQYPLRYIVLNRNGSANLLEVSSRNFNPLVLFNEMKCVP
jgi:hypothetical protein